MRKAKLSIFILLVLIAVFIITSFINTKTSEKDLIIGTWISEDDPNWTIEFTTDGNSQWNYISENPDNFTYNITTSSPQCGYEVQVAGSQFSYLTLTDSSDGDITCYEILGVDNESLSLSTISLGTNYFLFNKVPD